MNVPAENLTRFNLLGVLVSAVNMPAACRIIEESIIKKRKSYICLCPISTIIACQEDPKAMRSVNAASLAAPDGMPVVWLGKIYGNKGIGRVYGPDLMKEICRISEEKGYRNYFYGSTSETLEALKNKLWQIFPGLKISGSYSPPFRQAYALERESNIEMINNSNCDIIWVGLGSPKQDIWMHEHRERLTAPVLIGVGAAFDFVSGVKKQAPHWMQKTGLEWSFRLFYEPRRLWRRYILGNAFFLYRLISTSLKKIFMKKGIC